MARYSSILVALCVVTAVQGLFAPATAQQSQPRATADWVVPRTPDGHPDFQGTWTNETITPFERPQDQESPILTFEEVQQLQGGAVARIERGARPSDPDRAAPRAGGSVGGYNNVYMTGASTSPSSTASSGARSSPIRRTAVGRT